MLGVQRDRKRSRRRAAGGHVLGRCVLGVNEAFLARGGGGGGGVPGVTVKGNPHIVLKLLRR